MQAAALFEFIAAIIEKSNKTCLRLVQVQLSLQNTRVSETRV